jgi:hypothetical protein
MNLNVTIRTSGTLTLQQKKYVLQVYPAGLKFYTSASQTVMFTNGSGITLEYGDVVKWHASLANTIDVTSTQGDLNVLGVVQATILAGSVGPVATFPGLVVGIKCTTTAVNIGDYLQTSTTPTRAVTTGTTSSLSTFAKALTAKAAGTGIIWAELVSKVSSGDSGLGAGTIFALS